ncbi:protein kinase [Cyanobium sp. Cruz-8H5]|nr:protein kinase [Cyanobium sp. Cruz-8H5]
MTQEESAVVDELLDRWEESGMLEDPGSVCEGQPARIARAFRVRSGKLKAFSLCLDDWEFRPEVDGFEIVREIGRGGMGVVYLARQKYPARQVALKIADAAMWSPSRKERFQQEVSALARLTHPHIAKLFQAGTLSGTSSRSPYFAMEYVEGVSFAQLATDPTVDLLERVSFSALMCEAVQHAHDERVIHRDLKPANVMVRRRAADGTPEPVILDFGVAKLIDIDPLTLTGAGQLIGTVPYMAPELLVGRTEQWSEASDVYGLGLLIYELVTQGHRPYAFQGLSHSQQIHSICHDDPVPLRRWDSRIPRDLEVIVLKALEKDPARRYSSSIELARDLRRFLGRHPISARPPSTTYRVNRFVSRNRMLVTGVAATIAALTIGLAAALNQSFVADAQTVIALEATQNALKAEQKQVRLRHELLRSVVDSARKQGQWEQVLELLKAEDLDGAVAPVNSLSLRLAALRYTTGSREADLELERFRSRYPGLVQHPRVQFESAYLRYLRDGESALTVLRSVDPAVLSEAERYLIQAIESDTIPGLVRELELAQEHDPANPEILSLLAIHNLLLGKADQAARWTTTLSAVNPKSSNAKFLDAVVLNVRRLPSGPNSGPTVEDTGLTPDQHSSLALVARAVAAPSDVAAAPRNIVQIFHALGSSGGQFRWPPATSRLLGKMLALQFAQGLKQHERVVELTRQIREVWPIASIAATESVALDALGRRLEALAVARQALELDDPVVGRGLLHANVAAIALNSVAFDRPLPEEREVLIEVAASAINSAHRLNFFQSAQGASMFPSVAELLTTVGRPEISVVIGNDLWRGGQQDVGVARAVVAALLHTGDRARAREMLSKSEALWKTPNLQAELKRLRDAIDKQ